ncbi:MAG: site-specific DNA-methyltransferase, partial [Clostridia bacterium]|nr:site-specific DNA-methyltransferase [Clostridia bacterium]
ARVKPKEQTHQNQKPIDLLKQAIEKSSDEGAVVFDGFIGSGSTGVACVNTNRNFIGIELDEHYFDIAKKRIQDALSGN